MKKVLAIILCGLALTVQLEAGLFNKSLLDLVKKGDFNGCIKYFQEHGDGELETKENGDTPLLVALKKSSSEKNPIKKLTFLGIAKYLVKEKRADVVAVDKSGAYVLHYSVVFGDPDLVEAVVNRIIDGKLRENVDFKFPGSLSTPLHYATILLEEGDDRTKIIEILLGKGGANPFLEDIHGKTPASGFSEEEQREFEQYLNK